MLRCGATASILLLIASGPFAQAASDLSGRWSFTHVQGRFRGTITLRQSGSAVTGTWHTAVGKSEPDSSLAGQISGDTVSFTRSIGNLQQTYTVVLSKDGQRLDGFGDGWGINHANLNMQRDGSSTAPPPATTSKTSGFPQGPGAYKFAFQSVAQHRGDEIKYVSYYYEKATQKSIDSALPLPQGGLIAGAFPDDCEFGAVNDKNNRMEFRDQEEAKSKALPAGNWFFYPSNPTKCGGVVVFVK